jgi:hypothetical protein
MPVTAGDDMSSNLEKALSKRIGAQRAKSITRQLGLKIVRNPIIDRSPENAATAIEGIILYLGPGASDHDVAAEFVKKLMELL